MNNKPIDPTVRVPHPPAPTTQEDRALRTAVAYRILLKSRHPQWSEAKIIKKIKSQFNIQIA